jgi:AbrB family looped-hinge helix DNA binding protein
MKEIKDKYVGVCKVGDKGQIVIPKDARDMFGINPGDSVVVLCDKEKGMAIVKADIFDAISDGIFNKK